MDRKKYVQNPVQREILNTSDHTTLKVTDLEEDIFVVWAPFDSSEVTKDSDIFFIESSGYEIHFYNLLQVQCVP